MVKQRSMASLIESFRSSFGGECERLHEAILAGTGSVGSHVVQFAASQFGEGTTTVALGFGKFLSGIHGPNRVVVV